MNSFFRFLIAFFAITGATVFATALFGVEFAHLDFWDYHGLLFLVFISLFPRLTLLLSSVPLGGLLWWLGLIFAPRFLVAVLATYTYWNQNPILVVIAWLVALSGESSEKYVMVNRSRSYSQRGFETAKWVDAEPKSLGRD